MPAPAVRTPLAALLAERIRARGSMTFAEYMDACLYHPEYGYYSGDSLRRLTDYYTSVDVHPIFGRLLARQFMGMWEILGRPQPFWLVEAGAGAGGLAAHILDFAAEDAAGEFYPALRYCAVEVSATRRKALAAKLERHMGAGRAFSASDLPAEIPEGCIFSNELLDAMPVHRVVVEGGELREIYVDLEGENFADRLGALSTPELSAYFARQQVRLAEGQQAEASLAACQWIEEAGRRLGRGFVLSVDYGYEARELYDERHMRGTLLAYEQHRAGEDFYRAPGEQDLTAHVNFTAMDKCGARASLARTGLVSQAHFLMALAGASDFADLRRPEQGELEQLRARLQFKNLANPEGMGETFRVFIQHKGIPAPRLTGLEPL
ncbi:MAG TPA: SAM-dependent methyltransferase [Candidatus Acidoferrales bacterium]|jgi:SAM-dependent MidA family methyltransferase|nr:SAM-dependent methyltransferase [Candidatus Acidoferrales bacterium]